MLTQPTAREVDPAETPRGSVTRRRWAAAAVLAVLAAAGIALADGAALRPAGLGFVAEFFAAALQPRLDSAFLVITASATATTLGYALLGTAGSLLLGAIGGVLGSRTWWRLGRRGRYVWTGTRVALVVPRGIHEVVWGLFLLSVLGIEPLVAVLAIAIPFGAITAKVFSEIIDETEQRPTDTMMAAGAGRAAAFCYGLLPAASGELLSYSFYRLECAIRSAAILGLVGVGGLGFQLQLSFAALRYAEIWTLLYALIALSLAADTWGSAVRARLAARTGRGGTGRDLLLVGSLLVAAASLPLAWWWIGLDLAPLVDARSWQLAGQLLAASLPPTLGAGAAVAGGSGAGGVVGLLELCMDTLTMSILAIVLAFAGGLALAGPAARPTADRGSEPRRLVRRVTATGVRLLLVLLRAVPPPVWALVVLFVLAPGILAGAVALGVYTAGVLGRLMAETIENIDRRPLRALRSHGASAGQVFTYAVLPAASPRFAAFGCYRWEVAIRETVVVGVVGAGGLGLLLGTQLALFDYGGAVTTIGALIVLTMLGDLASAGLRRAVR